MYLWKIIRKRIWLECNEEQGTKERDIWELKDVKFWVEKLKNGIRKLLFIYNNKTYQIKIKHIGIKVITSTDCEDEFVDDAVCNFLTPWDYHRSLSRDLRSPYDIADNLLNGLFTPNDSNIKEAVDKINKHRPLYIKFTKDEKLRKEKEKEEWIKWFEHEKYIF